MRRYALSIVFGLLATLLPGEEVLVVGANVWSGLTYKGALSSGSHEEPGSRSFRFDLLTEELRALEPDVAVLFEANPLPKYANDIGSRLEMDSLFSVRRGGYRVGPVGFPTNLREGTVILADGALELGEAGHRRLSGGFVTNVTSAQSGEVSHVVASEITVAERRVHLFAVNLFPSPLAGPEPLNRLLQRYLAGELSGEEYRLRVGLAVNGAERRLEEARTAVTFINETAGADPAILVGTLSAPPGSPEVRLFVDAGFVDAWSRPGGITWDPENNGNIDIEANPQGPAEAVRIDYIMVRGEGIRVRGAEIILDAPTYGEYPSDHYGIAARIEVSPAAE
ncbi:MAG: endonuclease/exonuclease/phosphatase family protein [Spirochaetota bacterium]